MSSGGAHEAELLSVPLAWIGAMLVKRYPSCADIDDCFVIQCRAHLTSLSLPVVKCPGPLSLSSEVWTSVLASPSLTGTRYQTIVAARVAHSAFTAAIASSTYWIAPFECIRSMLPSQSAAFSISRAVFFAVAIRSSYRRYAAQQRIRGFRNDFNRASLNPVLRGVGQWRCSVRTGRPSE